MNRSKRAQLLTLAEIIDAHPDWWRFPTENFVKGFLGTAPLFIVGDQPSTSQWNASNPKRRALYDLLPKIDAANAHLTDLYKRRGLSGALKDGLPEDFQQHINFFRKEIEILRPTRVVALGHHAYQLLAQHTPELKPILKRVWHFSYVVRFGKLSQYEANMRDGIEGTRQVLHDFDIVLSVPAGKTIHLIGEYGIHAYPTRYSYQCDNVEYFTYRASGTGGIMRAVFRITSRFQSHPDAPTLLSNVAPENRDRVAGYVKALLSLIKRSEEVFFSDEPYQFFADSTGFSGKIPTP
jgi:hypothetical protein